MNHLYYYSLTGSTKKLAEAIAGELGIRAESIKSQAEAAPAADGILFIGSGSYGDKPSEDMSKFIQMHDFSGRKVALFGTSGKGEGLEVQGMAEALKRKGAIVLGCCHCKGKAFVVVNRGHPSPDDLSAARQFAREMAQLG